MMNTTVRLRFCEFEFDQVILCMEIGGSIRSLVSFAAPLAFHFVVR